MSQGWTNTGAPRSAQCRRNVTTPAESRSSSPTWLPISTPRCPAAAVAEPELADLLQYSWIVPVTNTALRRELEGLLVDRDLELPRDRVECSSFPIVRQLLIETDMVAALPMHLGSDDRLVALPTPLTPLGQSIGTITPADRTTSPSTAALLDELGHVAVELAAVDRLRSAAERA
jgi:DNA-binding transcriptional LysR family regulator